MRLNRLTKPHPNILLPLTSHNRVKKKKTHKESFSDKVTKASQPGTASQDFEKQLALVTLSVQESLKGKEKEIPPKVADQAPKPKLQLKLKP